MPKADGWTNSREPVSVSGDENAGVDWSPSLPRSKVVEDPVSHSFPVRNSTSGRSEKGKKAAPVAKLPYIGNLEDKEVWFSLKDFRETLNLLLSPTAHLTMLRSPRRIPGPIVTLGTPETYRGAGSNESSYWDGDEDVGTTSSSGLPPSNVVEDPVLHSFHTWNSTSERSKTLKGFRETLNFLLPSTAHRVMLQSSRTNTWHYETWPGRYITIRLHVRISEGWLARYDLAASRPP
ncbi:hypothetical protein ACEPAG_9311 [Sanghuangporus baumii]